MKKEFLFVFLALVITQVASAQARGTKIGYIDMEYILQNIPDYTEAQNQLETKAQKWKAEIEVKTNEINALREALKAEKALLTKELIEERETEIRFLEKEKSDYQQSRFGANGDLILQKAMLAKPIQDQVFTAIQDIAERLKYDFIFDKTSDMTMLFAAKRFDISEQVLRILNRTEKREQLTKKQQKEAEIKEAQEDAINDNPILAERQKELDQKKSAREQLMADRKLLQEQKKKEFEDKRKQMLEERQAKKNGTVSANATKEVQTAEVKPVDDGAKKATEDAKQKAATDRAKLIEEKKKAFEDRKTELENKRKKILEEREAAKKAKEEKLKENTNNN